MMQYIWLAWDILAVVMLILFIRSGAVQGFVRTLVGFTGYIVSAFVAKTVSPILARLTYDSVIKDTLRLVILNYLTDWAGDEAISANEIIGAMSGPLQRMIDSKALETVDIAANSDMEQLVKAVIEMLLREPVLSILQGIFFLLLFTIVLFFMRQLSKLFTGLHRVPVIGTVNMVLGGIVGAMKAVLVFFLFAIAFQLLITGSGGFFWLDNTVLEKTYIWRVFYKMLI